MPEKIMHQNIPQTVPMREGQLHSRIAARNPQATEESLIYAVYKRRPLWDPAVHFYRNNTVVKLLWDEVAQETGLNDSQARTRWKSLRDYYRIELKKINKAGGKDVKKSGWTYFQSMSFLEELMNNSMSSAILHSDESLSASEESIEAAESLLSISAKELKVAREVNMDHYSENKTENTNTNDEQLTINNDIPVDSTSPSNSDPLRPVLRNSLKMRPNFDMMHRKLLIQLENRRLELLEKSVRMEEDHDLLFFKSLLPLVKSLPESRRMRLRLKFQQLVCTEIEGLNQNSD